MQITTVHIENTLHLLAQTPQRLTAAGNVLDTAQLQYRPNKKVWSANDILAHLRSCADVWGDTIEAMLAQENPTLHHLSPRTYLRKTDYPQLNFHRSLQAFSSQRALLLAKLHQLETADWSRSAIIKERQHTVFSQARRMAHHEVTHCEQVDTLVAHLLAQ